MSSDTLSKKPFKKLISKVSCFRKSKSVDIEEKTSKKNSLHVSQNLTLTSVKQTGNELDATLVSKEIADKNLLFDPMQPTRELQEVPFLQLLLFTNTRSRTLWQIFATAL